MENFTEFDTLETKPQRDSSSIISHAFETYKKVIWYGVLIFVGVYFISSILSSLVGFNQQEAIETIREAVKTKNYDLINSIHGVKGSYAVQFFIGCLTAPLFAGFLYIINKANFKEEFTFSDLFIGFKQNTVQLILYYVFSTIIIYISIMLCVIPVIFVAPLLFLGFPIVFFENATAVDAIKKSFSITKENYGTFLGLAILTFLISISGLVVCCVGIIFTMMFTYVAQYSAYCAYFGAPKAIINK